MFLRYTLFFFLQKTKEALFTILGDLRPDDHFNFVSFSNRVRVWQPGKLVPVTPYTVRDAKKFIYMISPTGGTTPYTHTTSPSVTPCIKNHYYLLLYQYHKQEVYMKHKVKCTVSSLLQKLQVNLITNLIAIMIMS